jgi:hypothetical protein
MGSSDHVGVLDSLDGNDVDARPSRRLEGRSIAPSGAFPNETASGLKIGAYRLSGPQRARSASGSEDANLPGLLNAGPWLLIVKGAFAFPHCGAE